MTDHFRSTLRQLLTLWTDKRREEWVNLSKPVPLIAQGEKPLPLSELGKNKITKWRWCHKDWKCRAVAVFPTTCSFKPLRHNQPSSSNLERKSIIRGEIKGNLNFRVLIFYSESQMSGMLLVFYLWRPFGTCWCWSNLIILSGVQNLHWHILIKLPECSLPPTWRLVAGPLIKVVNLCRCCSD